MAGIDISSVSAPLNDGILQLQNGVPMDSTLRNVADQLNTTSPLKLSTNTVQVTSTLRITTNDNPYIDAEDGATNNRFTVGRAPASQQVNVDFASNPTGSTTVVGAIRTYVDGVNLSEVMTFREDGNVGIGTNAPTQALEIGGGNNIKLNNNGSLYLNSVRYATNNGAIYVGDINATNTPIYLIPQGGGANGSVRLGGGQLALFKGSGSTSATTSFLVQNSAGTQALKVTDDLITTASKINVTTQYPSYQINSVNVMDYGSGIRIGYDGSVTKITLFTNGGTPQLEINNSDQVYVGTTSPQASAKFEVTSTTRGFLPPRMTEAQVLAIVSPAVGLMAYNTDKDCPVFYSSAGWRKVSHSAM
jgi:hypothetical protein